METEVLVRRCKNGDREALAWLYRTYSGRLLSACRRIVGDDNVAEDILHDGFIIIFSSINMLRDASGLEAWMHRIVTNLALRYVNNRKDFTTVDGIDIAEPDAGSNVADVPFDELMAMVNRLPEGYRTVFRLSVLDGLPHNEIAAILGIEPRSSSSQLARAKHALRRMVAEYRARIGALAVLLFVAVAVTMLYYNSDVTTPLSVHDAGSGIAENRPNNAVAQSAAGTTAAVNTAEKGHTRANTHIISGLKDRLSVLAETLPRMDIPPVPCPGGVFVDSTSIAALPLPVSAAAHVADVQASERPVNDRDGWSFGVNSIAEQASNGMAARVLSLITHSLGSATRVDVESWEELTNYLTTYDVGDGLNSTERKALLEIAIKNKGRIITHKSFDRPLQLGLDFSKRLTDKLSLNFGLRLTRHTTNLNTGNTDTTSIAERQRTFFVGIPAALTYNVARHGRWSIYGTAGMAADIPFHGTSDTRFNLDNAVIYNRSGHLALPRWQWSVNIGAGVSYDITPYLQLYLSPKLTWYIPNGSSTETQWNDRPWQLSLPFGLRVVLR